MGSFRFMGSSSSRETSGKKGVSDFPFYLNLQHMETVGTVNFEDLFDFSPEPLDSPLENSSAEKLDDQEDYDQFNHLINQGVVVESRSNRSQSSQLSSPPATGTPKLRSHFSTDVKFCGNIYRFIRSISSGVNRQGQARSQAQQRFSCRHEDQIGTKPAIGQRVSSPQEIAISIS